MDVRIPELYETEDIPFEEKMIYRGIRSRS
jgi:hypothetical protein